MIRQVGGRALRIARFRALRALYEYFGSENMPDGRARKLLREWLTPEQRDQFDRCGHFEVTGGVSGKRYRVLNGTCANVLELGHDGEPIAGLCFVPDGHLAAGDVMLAQKIALETYEAGALAAANRFPPHLPTMSRRPLRPPF